MPPIYEFYIPIIIFEKYPDTWFLMQGSQIEKIVIILNKRLGVKGSAPGVLGTCTHILVQVMIYRRPRIG